jgi:predicted DNA-binding ribbon-helix-helix protein
MLICRNVKVDGRRTSLRMEPELWDAALDIAQRRAIGINDLLTELDQSRGDANLTGALRVYIISYYRRLVRGLDCYGLTRAVERAMPTGATIQ